MLPFQSFELPVSVGLPEAVRRLRAVTQESWFVTKADSEFIGRVTPAGFTLLATQRLLGRPWGTLYPTLRGRFEPVAGGLRLRITTGIAALSWIVSVLAVILFPVLVRAMAPAGSSPVLTSRPLLTGLVLVFLLADLAAGYRAKVRRVMQRLSELLESGGET